MRSFDHVLRIDPERLTADVEGMITYETLVDETLRYGLLPAVVPQLKTITLGGAVSGLGIESSSFKYGLVHETVEAMEILTGNGGHRGMLRVPEPGSVLRISQLLRHSRLRPASYHPAGSRAAVRLPYAHPVRGSGRVSSRVSPNSASEASDDFLDATIFGRDEMYVTQARSATSAPRVSDYTYMDIYYRSIQRKQNDWLTARGYIWRWDTDWFWCSKHFGVQNPAIRLFARPALNSRTYQRVMRLSQRAAAGFHERSRP